MNTTVDLSWIEEIDPLSALECALLHFGYSEDCAEIAPVAFTLTMSRDGIWGVTTVAVPD